MGNGTPETGQLAPVGRGSPQWEPRVGALAAPPSMRLQDSAWRGEHPPELVTVAGHRNPFGPGRAQNRQRRPPHASEVGLELMPEAGLTSLGESETTGPQQWGALRAHWELAF
ncbi:hypothetical protein NDU88_007164 [Pleurodeles waltl]|uniref:Uncharacterized protein n=1 Tax=Pleurodeles waltl TaxID=8319 RepID=A0AAV7U0G4_PLEWA|nr:hypothetical protein NDU88_007164 [Pleurodeles waltl]